jgi:hypothetical protein
MKCRFCEKESKLIKAHIIPEVFFRLARGDDMLTNISTGKRPQKSPIGAYDKGILCADCEKCFGEADSYTASFLIDPPLGSRAVMLFGSYFG